MLTRHHAGNVFRVSDYNSSVLAQVYTNIPRFKEDLTRYPPHFFICVPLVLDTLYNRVPPFAGFIQGNTWLFCSGVSGWSHAHVIVSMAQLLACCKVFQRE